MTKTKDVLISSLKAGDTFFVEGNEFFVVNMNSKQYKYDPDNVYCVFKKDWTLFYLQCTEIVTIIIKNK